MNGNVFNHLPALSLALPLLTAVLTPVVGLVPDKRVRNWFVSIVSGLLLVIALCLLVRVSTLGTQIYVMGAESWNISLPSGLNIPVRIILEVDSFNALMSVIVAIASFSGVIYALKFVDKFTGGSQYFAVYMFLTAGTQGLVLTGDMFNFFVFLEISSVAAFGLIAFWRDRAQAVEAAYKYMLVSQLSAMLVLYALSFIYAKYGVLNMAAFASVVQPGTIEKIIITFVLVALGMKCGMFPMHMWMPDAYAEAPASVTTLLVTTSQASLIVLVRFCFSLYGTAIGTQAVPWALIVLGCASMFGGVSMAVIQHEVKRLMGYHSVSQVGYMLTAFGVGLLALGDADAMRDFGFVAIEGGIYHMVNYMLYKGLLFLCAGSLYYAVGTRDLNGMGGLARKMPVTSVVFLIAAAAISGLPPFNGFVSKWLIYESVYAVHPILMVVALVTSVLTLASFVKIYQVAFLGPERPALAGVHEVPCAMRAGMIVMAVVILFFSLFPSWTMGHLVGPAAQALVNRSSYMAAVMGGPM